MQVSVETLEGLERKVRISVPAEKVEKEVSQRLKDLARKAKIPGFRPGKVPQHIIKSRFANGVREEVAREIIQPTLYEALQENNLVPADSPVIESEQLESEKDFIYTATFEVLPEINVVELNGDKIEVISAELTDEDVAKMIEKLREQNKEWKEVDRPVTQGDKVILDFHGTINNDPFEGGTAKKIEVIIGSKMMIPGFEEALIGGKKETPFDIQVTFPKNYDQENLAGKQANFAITIHKIMEGKLPDIDENFVAKFNIKEGTLEALNKDIQENMQRELDRRLSSLNREKAFDALLAINSFEIPNALVDKEIAHLKHELYHQLFGHEHKEDEKIPDFPRELFLEKAKQRVHLGLLFSEYVKKHELLADKERVDAMIDKLASAYENPEELRAWYKESKERLGDIEALVMEEVVADKIKENAQLEEKTMTYDEIMNPKSKEEAIEEKAKA